jgi:hypothetical protein
MKTNFPLVLMVLGACEQPAPEYEYGMLLSELELELISEDVGVHPNASVLLDPNNPFRNGLSGDMKFQVLEDGPIAGFYAFATSLAVEATGEHQFYTANQLQQIWDAGLAEPDELALVRDLGVRGYQQVLDTFTGAVTYDVTGRTAFDLMPLSIQGILALGGTPANGWKLAVGPNGELVAVQSGVSP